MSRSKGSTPSWRTWLPTSTIPTKISWMPYGRRKRSMMLSRKASSTRSRTSKPRGNKDVFGLSENQTADPDRQEHGEDHQVDGTHRHGENQAVQKREQSGIPLHPGIRIPDGRAFRSRHGNRDPLWPAERGKSARPLHRGLLRPRSLRGL